MKCPSCGSEDIKVIDSRPVPENNSIRRRRECLDCKTRFTTYEVIDAFHPIVLKKDGSKEYFDKYIQYIVLGALTHIALNLILYAAKIRKNL